MRKNWKRTREVGGGVETREVGVGRRREEGGREGEREHNGQRERSSLAHPQPSDVAVPISPALIASINNTALYNFSS